MRKSLNKPAKLFGLFYRLLPVLAGAALLAAHTV